MKAAIFFCFAFFMLATLPACHKCNDPGNPDCKNYNPCYQAGRFQPYFSMQEFCAGQTCGPYWTDYETTITRGGNIQFTSSDSIDSCEWHIGAGIYYKHQFYLNFNSAPDGAVIPIMLIVKHKQDTLCFPNNNGRDTIIRYLKKDFWGELEWGSWQGTFSDNPNATAVVSIRKFVNIIQGDTFYSISNLIQNYDSVNDGSFDTYYDVARQEIAFQINGNGVYNIYGDALTDSAGQNIQINYAYLDTPTYHLVRKTFTGKKL